MTALRSLFTFFCLLFTASAAFAQATANDAANFSPEQMASTLAITSTDVVQGSENAPLTMIEYASLSCSHCAHFHNDVLPALQKEFIDTGKLRFVNRDFPLNAPALKGAMLAKCAPEGKASKFKQVLYKLQSKWAFTPNFEDALRKIAKVGGLSDEDFDACMANKALEEEVLKTRQQAEENLPIQGTPAFFVNGKALPVSLNIEAFRQALNAATAATQQ